MTEAEIYLLLIVLLFEVAIAIGFIVTHWFVYQNRLEQIEWEAREHERIG